MTCKALKKNFFTAGAIPQRPAVFLDRDGTLNEEVDYLWREEDLHLLPGVPQALAALRRAGFVLVVVTNQSGVARGFFESADVERLHAAMQRRLQAVGAALDAFYFCPHHPTTGRPPYVQDCACRKGRPGMLLQAAADLHLDLAASYMIGDKEADLQAGAAAGCQPLLVLTGYGAESLRRLRHQGVEPRVFADLAAAAQAILDGGFPPVSTAS
ncbi:MAG: D-glycero-beta-D-manno-heptose 1,7-bisphosphate 7-phosphatase [Desulfuromonas thiophila]|jgi:D-glycero-D-manno-heptose 1,7-bisphosphate phosphatase|nr:D-glycero-beta-D-manno-heptose 1,7-bisphosphate 7-phosphatase [Desulfuromonas thiophila]